MRDRWCAAALCAVVLTTPGAGAGLPAPARKYIEDNCKSCHGPEQKKGGLDLGSLGTDLGRKELLARWVRIHDRVEKGEMPPGKAGKRKSAEKAAFLTGLSAELTKADLARAGTVLRRLNRREYENTVRDLFGINAELAELLPEDGRAHGFDTVGEALDISAVQMQRYMDAAGRALDAAIQTVPRPKQTKKVCTLTEPRAASFIGKQWLKRHDGAVVVFTNATYPPIQFFSSRADVEGRYRVRVRGYAYQSDGPVTFSAYTFSFARGGESQLVGYYSLPPGRAGAVTMEAYFRRGQMFRLVPQGLDSGIELRRAGVEKYRGPGLALLSVEIEGPLFDEWPGRGHRLLFGELPVEPAKFGRGRRVPGTIVSKAPVADAERLLKAFLPKAFRRPVADEKLRPYLALVKAELAEGANFEQAMRAAYTAALCSPAFLYLVEPKGKLDGHALASRLSYFLWGTAPDEELLAVAGRGELSRPAVLRAQTERLVKDSRSKRFVRDFVGQWLNLRDIDFTTPDRKLYPEFDSALKDAMVGETESFFAEVLREDRPVTDFLHSDWTMLNERLAEHYGVPGVKGTHFRKVKLDAKYHRGGVLAQASVLKVSANGTNTSPVTRGAWVLERILGEPPPPPPPGVPGVEPDIRGATTLREQLAKHRTLPSCNGCHKAIDPPGFALEKFDVIGGWRERYRVAGFARKPEDRLALRVARREVRVALGPAVDASGETPEGKRFSGPDEFKKALLAEPDRFARALTEKLAVYATGRGMGFSDRPAVADIVKQNAGAKRGFRDLVHRVVQSRLFQTK